MAGGCVNPLVVGGFGDGLASGLSLVFLMHLHLQCELCLLQWAGDAIAKLPAASILGPSRKFAWWGLTTPSRNY